MIAAAAESAVKPAASWWPTARADSAPIKGGSFAQAIADVDVAQALSLTSLPRVMEPHPGRTESALGALARQLDAVGRSRVEAQMLSAELAGAWATGMDAPAMAASMHRQARAMASYNVSVMWGAKLVGVTTGALRQLVAAT
jgi:hypothetical protein